MDNFIGKFGDLKKLFPSFKIPPTTEVELIIKPPEGFEEIMTPMKIKMPPPPKDMPEEEPPPPKGIKDAPPPLWFIRKLKSILKDNLIQRHSGNKRSGDLDMKHLYKAKTTGRVFTDRDVISAKRYNIALAVDASGSMQGERIQIASMCMKHFIEQFQKLVSLSVIVFNKETKVVKYPHQKMDEKAIKKLCREVESFPNGEGGGGNHDTFALKKSVELLDKGKGEKIIVMISDCEPACGCDSKECFKPRINPYTDLADTVKTIEAHNVQVLSLTIHRDFKSCYRQGAILTKVEEMYPALITLLSKAVKRGRI
jgi:Mg-chelatase subunit ChlD